MGFFFLFLIFGLTALAAYGMFFEIAFWREQQDFLADLDNSMSDPSDWEAAYAALKLDKDHPLHPAINRILATEGSPEAALDLVELPTRTGRLLSGLRKYAVSVLLLCGIAGTLFSLQGALPTDLEVTKAATSAAAFQDFHSRLSHAFLPSICGIVGTLLLQLARYGWLIPAQQATGRLLVEVASRWLIPWKQRKEHPSLAADSAATRFEMAAEVILNAVKVAAGMIHESTTATARSMAQFGSALDASCANVTKTFDGAASQMTQAFDAGSAKLMQTFEAGGTRMAQSFDAASQQILTASNGVIASVEGTAQQASASLAQLGTALVPVTDRMNEAVQILNKAGGSLKSSAEQFGKNLAANGDFHQAIEKLYAAVSPAEARYERLLAAVAELQRLSTSQNAELARLYGETTKLASCALQTAEESRRMVQEATKMAEGFPPVSQAVKDQGKVLNGIASQWQQAASALATEFGAFRESVTSFESSHGQALQTALRELPNTGARAMATHIPQAIQPLVQTLSQSMPGLSSLHEKLASLETAVKGLRNDLRSISVKKPSSGGGATIAKAGWIQRLLRRR